MYYFDYYYCRSNLKIWSICLQAMPNIPRNANNVYPPGYSSFCVEPDDRSYVDYRKDPRSDPNYRKWVKELGLTDADL